MPRDRLNATMAKEAMTTLDHLKSVGPAEDLASILKIMAEANINKIPMVQDSNIIDT